MYSTVLHKHSVHSVDNRCDIGEDERQENMWFFILSTKIYSFSWNGVDAHNIRSHMLSNAVQSVYTVYSKESAVRIHLTQNRLCTVQYIMYIAQSLTPETAVSEAFPPLLSLTHSLASWRERGEREKGSFIPLYSQTDRHACMLWVASHLEIYCAPVFIYILPFHWGFFLLVCSSGILVLLSVCYSIYYFLSLSRHVSLTISRYRLGNWILSCRVPNKLYFSSGWLVLVCSWSFFSADFSLVFTNISEICLPNYTVP